MKTNQWFHSQILDVAQHFGYYADTRTYAAWIRLKIREERQAELIISFHSLGVEFLGIIVASAFMEYRDKDEDEVMIEGPYPLGDEVFQFSYKEAEQAMVDRFEE